MVDDVCRGVWVFAEQRHGKLKNIGGELLTKGRQLADALQTELSAVCFGHNVGEVEQLIACGADRVYLVDSPELAANPEDLFTGQLAALIEQYRPEIVLAGGTPLGRAFIPRVAARVRTGLTADATGLDIDTAERLLWQTCPAFSGNFLVTIVCPERRPQMVTVRPRVFKKGAPDMKRQGEIIKVDFNRESITSRTRLLDFVADAAGTVNIDEAEIIIAGGRGLGTARDFKMLEELAAVMGAAVGATRPPVDEGWLPYSRQIGQTGKTVSPRLYLAVGISGAVQHLVGIQTSDVIVAINEDPSAPIFDIATYGIVGDLFKVIPLLTGKLKNR